LDAVMTPTRTLQQEFANPLEPSRSLQLNNRHWPGERFKLLPTIEEAERLIEQGELRRAARALRGLRSYFGSERFFTKFLRRLHRLHSFKSRFGWTIGQIELEGVALKDNQYVGGDTRASYPLRHVGSFGNLVAVTASEYRKQYGSDVVKMHSTVRFAKPDDRRNDVTAFGPLSDFHNDEYKGISTIVYLCDVTAESGAFSFIRDSHLIPRSLVLTAAHQCVEFDMGLQTPEQLQGVPLEFRGSLAVGNFLEQEKVAIVLRFQEVLEGRAGTFIMFNGQYLVHRGGKPLQGERTAAFFQPVGLMRHRVASVMSYVYGVTAK
jgi:hypothetical protein